MPLLNNAEHERYHKLGPKDLKWGGKDDSIAMVSITRSTIDTEQVTVNCPVFADDTRETLKDRLNMFFSVVQDRQDDANKAWAEVAEKEKQAREEERQKREEEKRAEEEARRAKKGKK